MKEIKLDSFSLFLILLVVLVISMVFMNWFFVYPSNEGFVSFQQNKNALDYISIPQYSSTKTKIAKIYDNIFMDAENGNLIEVDGTRYTTIVDSSGSSIQKIWIACRDDDAGNRLTSYSTVTGAQGVIQTRDTPESKKAFVNSMTPFIYKSNSTNTNRNYVVYVPYNDTTFIHTITIANESVNPVTYDYVNDIVYSHSTVAGIEIVSSADDDANKQLRTPVPDNDASNNSFVILPLYDPSQNVFQMTRTMFFNPLNGQFIIKRMNNNSPGITVFSRTKNDVTETYNTSNKETNVENVRFISRKSQDTTENKVCLYMGYGRKTVITIIEPTADSSSFQIFKVYRFNDNGTLDTELAKMPSKTHVPSGPPTPETNPPPSSVINPPPLDKDSMSDYYKWYWYWNTNGGSDMTNKNYSEDYLLKTQIIPPVCPSCPMCPNGGTCTNCNGIGGSSVNANTNTIVGNVVTRSNSVGGVTNNAIDTTGNLLYNTGAGAVGLGKDVVGGTVGLGRDAVGGAVGLGREVVGGTVGLARDAVGGAVGLATGAVGGAVGLVRDAAGGILNAGNPVQLNDMNRSGYNNSYGGQGQGQGQSSVTDPYSYYGARPASGTSNYMPITADFSRFGR